MEQCQISHRLLIYSCVSARSRQFYYNLWFLFIYFISTIYYITHWKQNIGKLNVHELFWMLQCNCTKNDEFTFFILNIDFFFSRNWVLLYMNENAKRSAESILMLIYLLSSVFPWYIWSKLKKLLKYDKYQLTKRWLEGKLEGFFKQLRNFRIFVIVVDGCIIIIHEVFTGRQRNQDRIAWIVSDCRSDRTPDRIGLVFLLLVQKIFRKAVFNNDTSGSEQEIRVLITGV